MTARMNGLSGYIPVRDGIKLDYCFREAVESLLPICDEVIVCDSDSTDGTKEALHEWAGHLPQLRIINYPWPRLPTPEEVERDDPHRPKGDPRMLIAWLNFTRTFCRYRYQITLDADEVLDPKSYRSIKDAMADGQPRWFHRINFWGDPFHEAPHGTVCGERVVRFGPTEMEMCSDEPRPEGEPEIRKQAVFDGTLRIFHLGFLRRQEAFLAKSRVMQGALHNTYDPRLRQAEQSGESWVKLSPFPADRPLLDYPQNDFPPYVRRWLQERGYKV